jgi:hypothetical protein
VFVKSRLSDVFLDSLDHTPTAFGLLREDEDDGQDLLGKRFRV